MRRQVTKGPFPSTAWELIRQAGSPSGREAIDTIWRRYSVPLRTHLLTRWRMNVNDADEILQAFALRKVLLGGLLSKADPGRGKFRSFLRTSLDNFVLDHLRIKQIRVEEFPEISTHKDDPEREYERTWARAMIAEALSEARKDCITGNQEHYWRLFEERVLQEGRTNDSDGTYASLISEESFDTGQQASNALVTVKRMVNRHLRALIAQDLEDPSLVDDEIKALRLLLTR